MDAFGKYKTIISARATDKRILKKSQDGGIVSAAFIYGLENNLLDGVIVADKEDGFKAVGFAFLFMAIVVYLVFRTPVPSAAVVLAAVSDIILAVGGMSLFGIPVSTATVAALLMLIGYSVDTDIMLTTRVLKRRAGSLDERINESMKTGMTMSITTIVAMFVLYLVVSYIVPAASLLKDISAVILFGLIADLMTTWMTNVGILRYYVSEYKGRK